MTYDQITAMTFDQVCDGPAVTISTVQGTVNDSSPTATSFKTTLTPPDTGSYVGALLTFTSGTLAGKSARILTFTTLNGVLTFASGAFSGAPGNGDAFSVAASGGGTLDGATNRPSLINSGHSSADGATNRPSLIGCAR